MLSPVGRIHVVDNIFHCNALYFIRGRTNYSSIRMHFLRVTADKIDAIILEHKPVRVHPGLKLVSCLESFLLKVKDDTLCLSGDDYHSVPSDSSQHLHRTRKALR